MLSKIVKLLACIVIAISFSACGDPELREGYEGGGNSPTGGSGTGSIKGYLCHYRGTSDPYGGSQFMKYAHFDGAGTIKYWEEYVTSGSGGGYGNSHPSVTGTYKVQGDRIIVMAGGQQYVGDVKYRRNGMISEFEMNGDHYAIDLCN